MVSSDLNVHYSDWSAYSLLDSGDYRKLERFGKLIVVRPEPKAWWPSSLSLKQWQNAEAVCDAEGHWSISRSIPHEWELTYNRLTFQARFTEMSKHVGIFPEQAPHWQWIDAQAKHCRRPVRLLSLFGYTGAASLIAAAAGMAVTHVDASKPAISWARLNQHLSGLEDAPVRWILDDAAKFIQREIRRGNRYDAFVLDPPAFGRGPKQEVWKIERNLVPLLDGCRQLLSDEPNFVILTMYAIEASALMIGNLLCDMMENFAGQIELGELALRPQSGSHILPLSIFGRWAKTS